uniref:Putative bifunctional DNA primase/polymerase n=1 Tax=viral metagenome TaxID=1070528 RepID=A0A6M3LU46_9ZZZZ
MAENILLEAALHYAEDYKWSVIPLAAGTKIPLKDFVFEPFREKIATREQIETWWRENPKYNIGVITGKLSNLLVVDLDKYKDHYKEENALMHFGDDIKTPIVETPRGGEHLYFNYPGQGITIGENILPAIDFRGEGGYAVLPPSDNGNGNFYRWTYSRDEFAHADCPVSFINILINKVPIYVTALSDDPMRDMGVTSVTECDIWQDGTRDKNLFHVAYCLAKTGNTNDYILQTLRALVWSWGERDERWVSAKAKSAMDRLENKERNVQAMVDEFILVTSGDFSVTNMDKELGFVTSRDMAAARKALSRRKDTLVEKAGKKDGWWRRIDTEIEEMDFEEENGDLSKIKLPFGLHELVDIYEGNIILVSGEFNAGKSLFAMTTLTMNKNKIPIRYMSSEMKAGEIKARYKWFGIDKEFYWPDKNCKYIALRNNIATAIIPDGLNFIDYMEFPEGNYTLATEYMKQIHDKLRKGIAVVCIQHKEGASLPRSADLAMEKPRLAIALRKISKDDDIVTGYATLIKVKHPKMGKMENKKLKYEIRHHGSEFKTLIDWGFWKNIGV